MKLREPRKTKKWHKKYGWSPRYTSTGELFYVRTYGPFRVRPAKCEACGGGLLGGAHEPWCLR